MKILFCAKPQSENFAIPYFNICDQAITKNTEGIKKHIHRYDLIWSEWANDFTAELFSERLPIKTMVRVHDHEIYQGRIFNINWENVDIIWFINRQAQEDFNKAINVKCEQFFLPNAIDPEVFEENISKEKHIGFLSIFSRPRKRIDRAIEVFKKVYENDPEWKMTIRAEPFDENHYKYEQMAAGLPIIWDRRSIDLERYGSEKEDVNEFFKDMSVVLSTSEHEGFHYAIAEGALCGCKPVVYNWEWGKAGDFWGPYVHNSIDEMADAILNCKPSQEYREYVVKNFSREKLSLELITKLKTYESNSIKV